MGSIDVFDAKEKGQMNAYAEDVPWIDRLVSVLKERWDDANGEPRWLMTYAELGTMAEHFPGTMIQIEAGMFETDGEIHARIKLMPPDAISESSTI